MDFSTDISVLFPVKSRSFIIQNMKLPTGNDSFFRAKQHEIYQQYVGARFFMREYDSEHFSKRFEGIEKETSRNFYYWSMRGYLLEAALMYYNIIIDLSWALCYSACEFAFYKNGKASKTKLGEMLSIEEASILREIEKTVTNPSSEESQFTYLGKICPEYAKAIKMISEFWNKVSGGEIRQLYNFIKHRGKPLYNEVDRFQIQPFMKVYNHKKSQNGNTECVSDSRAVREKVSLSELHDKLYRFDDETLYPYIKGLFDELEFVLEPSPLVF